MSNLPPPPHHFGSKGLGLGHGLDIVFAVFFGQFPLTIPLSGGEMNGKLTWKPGISYMYGHNLHYALQLSKATITVFSVLLNPMLNSIGAT